MRLIDGGALVRVPNVRKVAEYDETGEFITYLAVPVEAIDNPPPSKLNLCGMGGESIGLSGTLLDVEKYIHRIAAVVSKKKGKTHHNYCPQLRRKDGFGGR